MAELFCSYCGSANLSVYRVIGAKTYYKCGNCGRIVTQPIVMPDKVEPITSTE